MSNDDGVRSVDRAVAILDLLAGGGWRTGAEVARELKVHRSTALRLLGTLERHALVERDQRTARYRLGRRLPQLASVVTGELDLRYVARPVCEQLAVAAGETATLDALIGDVIVPIEQATASTSVMSVNWLGRRTPVHCTASGKAIAAFAPDAVRERLLSLPLDRVTPHTVTDRAELEAQLEIAQRDGVARTHEELEVGLDAVAAPVFGAGGEVLAASEAGRAETWPPAGVKPGLTEISRTPELCPCNPGRREPSLGLFLGRWAPGPYLEGKTKDEIG
jgi:DNA-binding IclR family transcriptional regulator